GPPASSGSVPQAEPPYARCAPPPSRPAGAIPDVPRTRGRSTGGTGRANWTPPAPGGLREGPALPSPRKGTGTPVEESPPPTPGGNGFRRSGARARPPRPDARRAAAAALRDGDTAPRSGHYRRSRPGAAPGGYSCLPTAPASRPRRRTAQRT